MTKTLSSESQPDYSSHAAGSILPTAQRSRTAKIPDSALLGLPVSACAVTFNYRYMRCAQFGLWQGARRAHTPQWVCNRRATQPQAKFGATLRAAVFFRPDFVARSLQIHCGICSPLAPRLAKKSLAAYVSIIGCHSTRSAPCRGCGGSVQGANDVLSAKILSLRN